MAAGDIADRVSHRDDDQTEGKGCQDVAGIIVSAALGDDSGAAAEENEHKGTDALSNILFHRFHQYNPP